MSEGFRFSPDILSRLGEELVPDAEQGIVELAKNAYDADATSCMVKLHDVHSGHGTITVSDNGIGMSAEGIRSGWLVIGRSAKQNKALTEIFRRVPAGDKGLGRLAALRLGSSICLKTRPRSEPGIEYQLSIDWEAFSKVEHVEDVTFDVKRGATENGPGTDIIIERVSERFGRTAVNKLARSLLLLSDPFQGTAAEPITSIPIDGNVAGNVPPVVDPGFKAQLQTPEFSDLQAKVSQSYFTDAEYRINAEVKENGSVVLRLYDWKDDILHEELASSTYEAPPLTFDLWVFILDSKSFSTRASTVGEVRDWLVQVGGVHIYEDGIRVPPYGGSSNDWLEMNLRRARSPEGRPSTNTSVGRVRLSNANGVLAQKTDRNGYIENEAFSEVRRVCQEALDWAARIQIRERDMQRQAEKEIARRTTTSAATRLTTVLNESVKSTDRKTVERAIAQLVKDSGRETQSLREELQLYRSLATAGMTSSVFAHEIGRPLQLIDQGIAALQRLIPAEKRLDAEKRLSRISSAKKRLNSFVSIPLTLLAKKKRRSGRVCVNVCVRELIALLSPITEYFKVVVDVDLTDQYTDINGSESLVDGICINLIMNSLNAFQREGFSQPNRIIHVQTRYDGSSVVLLIEDNAGGIDGVEVKDIWLPGVTTSPNGTGFGLTIVRDSVTDLAGTIDVVPKSEFGGAQFTVRLPPMRTLFQ